MSHIHTYTHVYHHVSRLRSASFLLQRVLSFHTLITVTTTMPFGNVSLSLRKGQKEARPALGEPHGVLSGRRYHEVPFPLAFLPFSPATPHQPHTTSYYLQHGGFLPSFLLNIVPLRCKKVQQVHVHTHKYQSSPQGGAPPRVR